jgi:hypothetical protein
MKLGFDPQDAEDKREVPQGVYDYRISNIEEREFSTGTKGLTVKFDVFLEDRFIQVYENMYYTPRALWKLKDLCSSIGVEFKEGLDSEDLIGQSGRAFFGREKSDKFLKLMEFVKDGTPEEKKKIPPSVKTDDVPF